MLAFGWCRATPPDACLHKGTGTPPIAERQVGFPCAVLKIPTRRWRSGWGTGIIDQQLRNPLFPAGSHRVFSPSVHQPNIYAVKHRDYLSSLGYKLTEMYQGRWRRECRFLAKGRQGYLCGVVWMKV